MSCTPNPLNLTNVTANDSTSNDFACSAGGPGVWTGAVTQLSNGNANVKKISIVTLTGTAASAGINGTCPAFTTDPDGKQRYTCTISQIASTWSGTLNFTSAGGAICPYVSAAATTKTYTQTNKTAGTYTQDLRIGKADGSGCP